MNYGGHKKKYEKIKTTVIKCICEQNAIKINSSFDASPEILISREHFNLYIFVLNVLSVHTFSLYIEFIHVLLKRLLRKFWTYFFLHCY